MIYIHGGDFMYGASNVFPAHVMATFYKVVVVSINYRLGALGFLSTGDENSPGMNENCSARCYRTIFRAHTHNAIANKTNLLKFRKLWYFGPIAGHPMDL